jgi:hypothetical protein
MDALFNPSSATPSSRLFDHIVPIYQMAKALPYHTFNGLQTVTTENTDDKGRIYYTLYTRDATTLRRHGFHLSWWSADMSLSLELYLDGVFHGTNYEWNAQGQLIYQSDYQNGKKQGWTYTFHPNGRTAQITYFEAGKRMGSDVEYDTEGYVKSISKYAADQTLMEIKTFHKGSPIKVYNC